MSGPTDRAGYWNAEEQQRADELQMEQARLYRSLRAALRREPTPRELWRAREAFYHGRESRS